MLAYETEALATEAETKACSVEIKAKAKTKTFSLEAEARPRRLKFQPRRDRGASRRPCDRGIKIKATSLQT